MSERKKTFFTILITFLATSLAYNLFLPLQSPHVISVKSLIKQKYVEEVTTEDLDNYTASAIVDALQDPYSYYLSNDDYSSLMSDITGTYEGIGIEIYANTDDRIAISAVFADTPAYKQGIKSGDIIVRVDDIVVSRETYADAVSYLRGISEESEDETEMELELLRGDETIIISISREPIESETVFTKELDGIFYVRITNFTSTTSDEFSKCVEDIESRGYSGIIIDVRGNPGGLLESVANVADTILPECLIVYTENKDGKQKIYNSDKSSIDLPLVLLIDMGSASASEVLAGAIKDNSAGTLIGETTFGKGSVQDIFRLKGGSAVKLTTAYYYTPSGICIHDVGIEPDVEVFLPEERDYVPLSLLPLEQDTQLQEALKFLAS